MARGDITNITSCKMQFKHHSVQMHLAVSLCGGIVGYKTIQPTRLEQPHTHHTYMRIGCFALIDGDRTLEVTLVVTHPFLCRKRF